MYDMNFPYRDLYESIIMSGGSKMRKNTTVKRTLALTMAVLMGASLAGCGSKSEGASSKVKKINLFEGRVLSFWQYLF